MEMYGTGSKGSLKDRLLHNIRKRKNSKLLNEEILMEEEELKKEKEKSKKKKELQFVLIRNYFEEQVIEPTVADDVYISDAKRKIITASQVVLAGMGLIAIGISGGSSKKEEEKELEDEIEELYTQNDYEEQEEKEIIEEEEIVSAEVIEDTKEDVSIEEMIEEDFKDDVVTGDVSLEIDSFGQAEEVKNEEHGLKRIEKRIDSLDRSLIESAYQTSMSKSSKEHDMDISMSSSFKDICSGVLLSNVIFMTSMQDKRFSNMNFIKQETYFNDPKVEDKKEDVEIKKVKPPVRRKRTMVVNDLNYQLASELAKQMQYINGLKERITQADKNNNLDFKLTTTCSLMGNIFKLSMGILTLPFENKKLVSPQLMIGSVLINHALKGLKVNVFGDPNYQVYNEYRNFLNEISAGKNELETVQVLLSDSLDEVQRVKADFYEIFKDYEGNAPEYDDVLSKIDKIEQSLEKKQEVLRQMENTLDEEYENNKIKIKRMEG